MVDFPLNLVPAPVWFVATIVCTSCKNQWIGVFPNVSASGIPILQCPECKEAKGIPRSYHGLKYPIRDLWPERNGPLVVYDQYLGEEKRELIDSGMKTVDDFLESVFHADAQGNAFDD